jgi:hypothetical protein
MFKTTRFPTAPHQPTKKPPRARAVKVFLAACQMMQATI